MFVEIVFFILLSDFFSYRIGSDHVIEATFDSFRYVFTCVSHHVIEGDNVRHLFGGLRDETRICIV
jgi:hypothetical protein